MIQRDYIQLQGRRLGGQGIAATGGLSQMIQVKLGNQVAVLNARRCGRTFRSNNTYHYTLNMDLS